MMRAAEQASRSLARDFGEVENLQVSMKSPGNFVTAADKRSEEILFEALQKARPDFNFLMEESGEKKISNDKDAPCWLIDPIDGTHNFMHGIPHWCISIGLKEKDEITAGIIFDPIKDELFWAAKGAGAFMKTRRLRVSSRNSLREAVISCDIPSAARGDTEKFHKEADAIMKSSAMKMRSMGSCALDLAYVAAGRYDAMWNKKINPWDVGAGIVIVKEAGGYVSNLKGQSHTSEDPSIIAANTHIHADFLKLLKAAA